MELRRRIYKKWSMLDVDSHGTDILPVIYTGASNKNRHLSLLWLMTHFRHVDVRDYYLSPRPLSPSDRMEFVEL